MTKISSKFVLFGAVAAAVLVIPAMLGPIMLQEAQAARQDQAIESVQQHARGAIAANVNVGANVAANVEDNNVAACVLVGTCNPNQ